MTLEETRMLLGEVAAIDNRKATPDTLRMWHETLQGFTLAECREALSQFRRNRPDDWVLPGHLAQIANRNSAGTAHVPKCSHGVPLGGGCHDCTHPADCPVCTHDAESAKAKRWHRASWAVVYPGEAECLDGHDQRAHAPLITVKGRLCGHPAHHEHEPSW